MGFLYIEGMPSACVMCSLCSHEHPTTTERLRLSGREVTWQHPTSLLTRRVGTHVRSRATEPLGGSGARRIGTDGNVLEFQNVLFVKMREYRYITLSIWFYGFSIFPVVIDHHRGHFLAPVYSHFPVSLPFTILRGLLCCRLHEVTPHRQTLNFAFELLY